MGFTSRRRDLRQGDRCCGSDFRSLRHVMTGNLTPSLSMFMFMNCSCPFSNFIRSCAVAPQSHAIAPSMSDSLSSVASRRPEHCVMASDNCRRRRPSHPFALALLHRRVAVRRLHFDPILLDFTWLKLWAVCASQSDSLAAGQVDGTRMCSARAVSSRVCA